MIKKPTDTVAAGDVIEIQFSPFGEYPCTIDGRRVVQLCDEIAFNDVVANFEPGQRLLVDREHNFADTTAYGWTRSLRVDDQDGLVGGVELTDIGAEAINNKHLLFVSSDWDLDLRTRRPIRLKTAGLTNRPNIPVQPILNKAAPDNPTVEGPKEKPNMQEIAKLLGLPPETATEADVIAGIKALQDKLAAQAAEALNAEAEDCAEKNKARIANKEAFISSYKANPEAAKAMLGALKAEAEPETARVTNKAEARTPSFASRGAGDVLATYESLKGKEKSAYLTAHADAICEARARAAQ